MGDVNLPDDTPIYRIFNIYDLITTIETQRLRLGQAASMEDKNEVLGEYLLSLNSLFGPESDVENRSRLDQHLHSQLVQYMTCWTRSPDNVAVWSLYSATYEGILVRSTAGKLRVALDAFYQAHNFGIAYSLEPNDKRDLFYPPKFGPIRYVDFSSLLDRLVEIRESYRRLLGAAVSATGSQSTDAIAKAMEHRDEESRRMFEEQGLSVEIASFLKDRRYEHEKEVRAAIRLVRRDHRTQDEYEGHPLAGFDSPICAPPLSDCPANIFIPLNSDFIQSLEMDGRLPAWRQEAVRILFKRLGFDIFPNTAFASIPDRERWRQRMTKNFA